MRKIHDSYDRLQNPWYRRPRIVGIVSLVLCLVVAGAFLGIRFVSERNRERTLDHIDASFAENDLSSVQRTLSLALRNDADNEDLQVQYARLLSRIQPRAAVDAWERVVRDSQEPEYAVAYVLAAIQVKDFESAHRGIASLKNHQDAASEYHRAAFALAFAEGNDPVAFVHIDALRNLYPEEIAYEIEHARIGVRSQNTDLRARSEAFLWELSDSRPDLRSDAQKALANSYLDRREENNLMRVLEHVRDIEADTEVRSLLWAIEAEQRMWGDVPVENVREVWRLAIEMGQQDVWLKLLSWMNAFGYAEHAIEWATERPSESVWTFPSGYLLARSASLSGDAAAVTAGLKNAEWGDRDFLRLINLSLLTERGTSRTFWLDQAYFSANSLTPGGGRLLIPVLWEWGWLEAEVSVVTRVLEEIALAPAGLRGLFQRIEAAGDMGLMYQLNRALLQQFPDQPAFLNNAAYYATVLNRDAESTREWALAAQGLHPQVTEFRETLALVHAVSGEVPEAQVLLDSMDVGEGLMARLVIAVKMGEETDKWMQTILENEGLTDQERDFVKRWSK